MNEYEDLLKRGFSKGEALETIKVIKKAQEKKIFWIRMLDSIVYWFLLLVAIVGNLIISIVLVPFLLTLKPIPLYFTIVLLAAMFGFLFGQVIREIEHLKVKDHIIAWVFIPTLAVINTYYMTQFANHVKIVMNLPIKFNSPIIVSIVYVFAFMVPFVVSNIVESAMEGGFLKKRKSATGV